MVKKKFEKQQSERDIYNIQGNLNLGGGSLQIENLFLENGEGVESELIKAEQKKLFDNFSISYIEFIKKQFEGKTLLHRQIVKDFHSQFRSCSQLMISGEPGSGKTCILFQLSSFVSNAVYLSIRNRSHLNVLNHLINKIRIQHQDTLLTANDTEEAIGILQGLLQSSEAVFFIDDCEADTVITSKLIDLEKGLNHFIFASRNARLFDFTGIQTLPVTTFTESETREYLALCGIELDTLSFNQVFHASQGNALYLFYFSKYQINPLPADINNYHKAIWASLTSEEHESLAYIALAYREITVEDLFELLHDKRPTETVVRLVKLSSLVNNQEGKLTIFHPAFKDYIEERLRRDGLLGLYGEKLGTHFLSKKRLIDAAWLLIDTQPEKVNSFGLDTMSAVIISGDLHFAVKLINTLLQYKRPLLELGYLEYHLSCVYRFLHQEALSEEHLERAIVLFKRIKDKHLLLNAQMVRAMNLVENGRHEEGLALADSIFARSGKYGDQLRARNLVNLTKIYLDLSEFGKGAKSAKEAFDIFERLKQPEGMAASLANLSSCLAKLDDYSDLAESYALKLLNLHHPGIEFTIKLIALNILASINRQKQDFAEAKKYGNEAVKLCQKYDLPEKLVLNLVNYGNIVRDENNVAGAIKIYEEALIHAKDHGLKRDEGRIYWILSSIYYDMDEVDKSIDYADRSITVSKQINYRYGIAHAGEEKAKALVKKGDKLSAAEAFEESAMIFLKIENFSKNTKASFSKAILLYFETGQVEKANRLLAISIMDVPHNNFEELDQIVKEESVIDLGNTIHQSYQKLAAKYADPTFTQNTIRKFLVYLNYCQRTPLQSKNSFLEVLTTLAVNCGKNRFALTTLGILVEQSKTLVDSNDLNKLIKLLVKELEGFHWRETFDEQVVLASVSDILKIQVHALKDDILAMKLTLTAILFLYASPELVVSKKKPVKSFYTMLIVDLNEIIKAGSDLKIPDKQFSENHQTLILSKVTPETKDSVYINTIYEKTADLISYPNNKCLMYFLGTIVMRLTSHFYNEKKGIDKNASKYITQKLAYFFDYTSIEEHKNVTLEFGINLENLK